MNYHPVVNQIKSLLDQNQYWYETFEHEPVRTSQEAAAVRTGYSLSQGAKALILRVKKSEKEKFFVMVVLSGEDRFESQKIKNLFQAKDIRFATEEEVDQITGGVQPGGVPPFGNLFNLQIYADKNLFNHEKIIFNAGDKRFSIAIKSSDYLNLVKPVIIDAV